MREERRVGLNKPARREGLERACPGSGNKPDWPGGGRRHSDLQGPGQSVRREVKGLRVHVQARDPTDDMVQ